jgi:hypothetical protein
MEAHARHEPEVFSQFIEACTEVDADDERAALVWRDVPYLADRNYRLYLVAMMAKCCELCTSKRPTLTIAGHGDDWIDLRVVY